MNRRIRKSEVGYRNVLECSFAVLLSVVLLPSCDTERETQQLEGLFRISEDGAYRPAETSVVINPDQPDNVVAAFFQYGSPGKPRTQNFTYISTDGGKSWEPVESHNPDGRVQGDDAVAADASGRLYHSYISFDGIRTARPEIARNGIFVQTSRNNGTVWGDPVPVVDHLNTVRPFEDKPYLRADRETGSPHYGNLYVAWTHFDGYASEASGDSSQIHFSVSVNQGKTFSVPIRVSDRGGDCLDGDNTVEGAVPAVGIDGEVYIVWAGPQGLVFDKSIDGGMSFGRDHKISDMPGGWDMPIGGLGRANGMPVTAVDHSNGPHRGRLYVNWIDSRHGDPDVFIAHSDDRGESWSDPVRVNTDPIGNQKEQFFTWIAVDPVDGSANLVFFDRRSTEGAFTRVTLARSVDGGSLFINQDIGLPAFETNPEVFFGDYIGIDALDGRVIAVFPHFISDDNLAVSAFVSNWRPGTLEEY